MTRIKSPDVSIVVPAHRPGKTLTACLDSLRCLDPPPLEVILVADGNTDAADEAESAGFQVETTTRAGGPARARNLGAEKANGAILFFVDSDVTVCQDAVARVTMTLHPDSEFDAVIGSYDDRPGDPAFLSQYRNLFHHYIHQAAEETASTFWGACGAIRREVFYSVGGFDESYVRPSVEDIHLGYRLVQKGHRIRLDKDLQVKHLKHWSPIEMVKTDFFSRALPWTLLMLRHKHFVSDLNVRLRHRLSVTCVFIMALAAILATIRIEIGAICLLLIPVLVLLNHETYRFFLRKRGPWFVLRVLPWHWLYYFYGGLAFAIGVFWHLTGIQSKRNTETGPMQETR